MIERLLKTKEATIFLGFSEKSNILAKMRMKRNKDKYKVVPKVTTINGNIRYKISDLEEFIKLSNLQQGA